MSELRRWKSRLLETEDEENDLTKEEIIEGFLGVILPIGGDETEREIRITEDSANFIRNVFRDYGVWEDLDPTEESIEGFLVFYGPSGDEYALTDNGDELILETEDILTKLVVEEV